MLKYIEAAFGFTLFIMMGWHSIILSKSHPKSSSNARMLRWSGYGLILVVAFLLVVGVIVYFDGESHRIGH